MNIYKCRTCKREFDKVHKSCPHCRGSLKRKRIVSLSSAVEIIGNIAELIVEIVT